MKKVLSLLLIVCLVFVACISFTACTPREEMLIIQNWEDYMDEAEYKGFEDWYKEKTGKKVKVVYETFETNEEVRTKLANGEDYDLICPSDYMVQRMIREDMLQEMNAETKAVVQASIDPAIKTLSATYDPGMKYSMPYLWGTLGIMYNSKATNQNEETMSSWAALWDTQFGEKKVTMKNSERDIYTVAMLYLNRVELLAAIDEFDVDSDEYKAILDPIFNVATQAKLDTAKEALKQQKDSGVFKKYDVDLEKADMEGDINGTTGNFGMFWSCDAGFAMDGNQNLRYIIPEEGSNVWVDGFVITKNAKNVEAANMFLQYLCEKDVAYACMDYAGCTSAVKEAAEEYKEDLESDFEAGEGIFEDAPEGFGEMYIEMMFPSEETLARCRIMRDFGDLNEAVKQMLLDVKAYKS